MRAGVLLALTLLSSAALAADLPGTGALGGGSLQTTDDFELRYHHFAPEDQLPDFEDLYVQDYVEQVNRLNLLAANQGLSLGLQLDEVALFANRYILDGTLHHSWPLYSGEVLSPWDDAYVNLEKIYLQRRWKAVELTLGDTYASFGRGMALNIVKNTDIDVDTSVRGAKVVFRASKADITLLSGVSNRQQVSQDNRNRDISPDLHHMVTGGAVQIYGVGPSNLGLHGAVYRFARVDAPPGSIARYEEPLDAVVGGATVALTGVAGVDWYAEGDLFRYAAEELGGGDQALLGFAGYGSASAYPGRSVVLLELKRTRDTERVNTFVSADNWEVSNVPTLEFERVITEDASAAVNSNDLAGARLRVDYGAVPGKLTPFVSVAALRDCDTGGLHFNRTPESVVHPITGVQWLGEANHLQVDAGFRQDSRDEPMKAAGSSLLCGEREADIGVSADQDPDQLAHLDADLHLALFGEESLELVLAGRRFWWGSNPQQQEDFLEMSNALTWQHGSDLALTLYQDWSDNPLISSEGNLSEHVYGAVEAQYKPRPSMVLRVFYGAYKAGIHCSGGQCRSLPGFEGAKFSFTGTF